MTPDEQTLIDVFGAGVEFHPDYPQMLRAVQVAAREARKACVRIAWAQAADAQRARSAVGAGESVLAASVYAGMEDAARQIAALLQACGGREG